MKMSVDIKETNSLGKCKGLEYIWRVVSGVVSGSNEVGENMG